MIVKGVNVQTIKILIRIFYAELMTVTFITSNIAFYNLSNFHGLKLEFKIGLDGVLSIQLYHPNGFNNTIEYYNVK